MLDRWFAGLMSAGIHLALLLGAAIVVAGRLDLGGTEGSGFACSIREDGARIQRIERAPDLRQMRTPDSSLLPEAILAEEMSFAFRVGKEREGCIACRYGARADEILARLNGPQGLCCRHVIMMQDGLPEERSSSAQARIDRITRAFSTPVRR